MEIGILTYYNVHNHGALLQANALKTLLQSYGHQVVFLKFQRNYDFIKITHARKYNIKISSIPYYFDYLLKNGLRSILFNLNKAKKLNQFRISNFSMNERYSDFEGDIVVIGSDEVFSTEIGLNYFFYGHGIKANKILSYAASFGPTTFDSILKQNVDGLICSGLRKMDAIGVRDNNSQKIVNELCGASAEIVCDPVILYGYQEEQKMYIPKQKNYMLVYSYDKNLNDEIETNPIKKYARKNNLKIISVGYYHKWCDQNINVSPVELLGYFKNAKLVITDTFHGSVLSLICNAQFVAKARTNQNKLLWLLDEYRLNERIITDFSDLEAVMSQVINYNEVNAIIEEKRTASERFLVNSVGCD